MAEGSPTPALREPAYRVEVDNRGCARCGARKSLTVVGPDDVALGESWELQDDAESVAELLNEAFEKGRTLGRRGGRWGPRGSLTR